MLSIKVPPLGESIVEATISRWLKNEGERVAPGETLVELETDKVTVEVPASKAGVLVRRLKSEGDVVAVGDDLGELDETANGTGPAADARAASPAQGETAPLATATTVSPPAPASSPAPATGTSPTSAPASAPPPPAPGDAEVKASPAARRLSTEEGVDLGAVPGTGRGGVVSKPDVVEHIASTQTATVPVPTSPSAPQVDVVRPEPPREVAPAAPVEAQGAKAAPSAPPLPSPVPRSPSDGVRETREKMSTRRKRIAEHLLESQHTTAHLTTFNEIDMSAVEALRARVKERVEKEHGVKLSFMPFFAKAACFALKQYPTVNAKIDGDSIVYHHYVNMGIAVASDTGLVVPNVKGADSIGLLDLGRSIAAVAKKARDGKLTMDDLTGGTFTITNGGVFGSLVSTPIINYPQSGILGLHKIQDRPVAVNGQVVIRPMMYVALSYDHRLIDGQQAVLFLVRVKELMEDPAMMVID